MNQVIRSKVAVVFIVVLLLGGMAVLAFAQDVAPASWQASEGVPSTISYQGRVTVDGEPFDGVGYFMFALVNSQGSYTWTSDQTLARTNSGIVSAPSHPVELRVRSGLFNVLLGDTHLNMVPIQSSMLEDPETVLRVWFSPDSSAPFVQLPDKPLSAVPYALVAGRANTLGGQPASAFATANHDHWGETWRGNGTGLSLVSEDDTGLSAIGVPWGLTGEASGSTGVGVYGLASSSSGANTGVYGRSDSPQGTGVFGYAAAATGDDAWGVFGKTDSTTGRGVYGWATTSTGANFGVLGQSASESGYGVFGHAYSTSGVNYGVYGKSDSNMGIGVLGCAPFTGTVGLAAKYGVFGQNAMASGAGVFGTSANSNGTGVRGETISGHGVEGVAERGVGVYGSGMFHGQAALFENATVNTSTVVIRNLNAIAGSPAMSVTGRIVVTAPIGIVSESGRSNGIAIIGRNRNPNGYGIVSQGNLFVDGKVSWSPVIHTLSLPAAAFVPGYNGIPYNNQKFLRNLESSISNSQRPFVAPVFLPDQVVIRELGEIVLTHFDWTDQWEQNVVMYLKRINLSTGSMETMETVEMSGSLNKGEIGRFLVQCNHIVDNANYVYFVEISIPGTAFEIDLVAAFIKYEVTQP